jgi:hypothetical protein
MKHAFKESKSVLVCVTCCEPVSIEINENGKETYYCNRCELLRNRSQRFWLEYSQKTEIKETED